MKTFYQQCQLKQGNSTTVTWLPEKHCKVGHRVSIKDDDEWSAPWTVASISKDSKTESPPDYRKLIRSHRKSTGDSLPKLTGKKKNKR